MVLVCQGFVQKCLTQSYIQFFWLNFYHELANNILVLTIIKVVIPHEMVFCARFKKIAVNEWLSDKCIGCFFLYLKLESNLPVILKIPFESMDLNVKDYLPFE